MASTSDFFCAVLFTGHSGSVSVYRARMTLRAPDTTYCMDVSCMAAPPTFTRSTNHMEQMKPTVPHTLIGGKSFTGSRPDFSSTV